MLTGLSRQPAWIVGGKLEASCLLAVAGLRRARRRGGIATRLPRATPSPATIRGRPANRLSTPWVP